MTDLASLVVRLEADASVYLKELDKATKALNKFSKDQNDLAAQVGDKLKEVATQLVAAFAVEHIVEFTTAAIEAQASLAQFSQIAGVSVETLSQFGIVAAAVGVNQDELGLSFKKLNVAISEAAGDASTKAAVAFKLLGINVRDSSGNVKDAATVNDEVADAFSKSADGANKVALAVALYGKAGQTMIPILDQGSAAIHAQEEAARAAGATLSGDAAEAAETYERKLNTLSATLKGQLANAITAEVVPALTEMIDAFNKSGGGAESVQILAAELVTGLKLVANIGLEVARTFQSVGDALGSLGAQAVALAHGRFAEVNQIAADNGQQQATRDKAFADTEAALWKSAADRKIEEAERAAAGVADANDKGPKADLGSLAAGEASAAADKKLKDFAAGLKDQALSFGLGEAALVRYKLQFGSLADDYKKAGDEGKAFAAAAIKNAEALQFKKDSKTSDDLSKQLREQIAALDQSDVAAFKYKITTGELGDAFTRMGAAGRAAQASLIALDNTIIDDKDKKAIQALNDEIAKTKGLLVDSGTAAFDLQNKSLKQNATDRGDTAGLAVIQQRRDQIELLDQYNQLVAKSVDIEKSEAEAEAQLNLLREKGALSDLEYQKQSDATKQRELDQLGQIYTQEKAIADGAGKDIPEIQEKTKALDTQMKQLGVTMDQLTKQIRTGLESAFANNFSDLITGAKTFHQALTGFLKDIEKQFADLISKNFAQQLFGTGGPAGGAAGGLASLFGSGGGGAGGIASLFSGLFGGGSSSTGAKSISSDTQSGISDILNFAGGYATGGTVPANSYALVGENGPEYAYSGSQNLQIQPMSGGGKSVQQTNNFNISAPGGTISRQSQSQVAAAAARQVGAAQRRRSA